MVLYRSPSCTPHPLHPRLATPISFGRRWGPDSVAETSRGLLSSVSTQVPFLLPPVFESYRSTVSHPFLALFRPSPGALSTFDGPAPARGESRLPYDLGSPRCCQPVSLLLVVVLRLSPDGRGSDPLCGGRRGSLRRVPLERLCVSCVSLVRPVPINT